MDTWSGNSKQPSSLNKYMYARADPVNRSDPTGLDATLTGEVTTLNVSSTISLQNFSSAAYYGSAVVVAIAAVYIDQAIEANNEDLADDDISMAYGPQPASAQTPQAQIDHDAYKNGPCNPKNMLPPPQPTSPIPLCDALLHAQEQWEACQDARQAWDDKYWPGRHADVIGKIYVTIQRLGQDIVKACNGRK